MSIQDRIRAMNKTLQEEDDLIDSSPKSVAAPTHRPTTPRVSSATEETVDMSDEELMPTKRSSVVDMWRKREGSMNRGAAAGRASPVTFTPPPKLQARASPVSEKQASQVAVGLSSSPAHVEQVGDNLDNNAEVYSFDEKKDQAFEETEQTSEIEEENKPVPSNHTMLNPVSSGPVDMTYLPARESPGRPPSPANYWSKRVAQHAGAALPSPVHHETPAVENHHQAQDAQDTNTPKPSSVKDIWTKRAGGEGSFPFNQPQNGDSFRRSKDMPPLPGTPKAGANLISQSISLVAGGSPKVAGSSPRTSVRDRWLQHENADSGRQTGYSSEKDEEEEELELINGGISAGGVSTAHRSEPAPLTPRTPGRGVVDRWTKRIQISPGNNYIPSSPVIPSSPGAKIDVSGRFSPFDDVRAQWTNRGSEQDHGKEHLPALTIPHMKEEEEQEPVNTIEISRDPESAGVPSPGSSMGKLCAKRQTTTESQSNEKTGEDDAATDGCGAPACKQSLPSGDSRLNSASPSAGVTQKVLRSTSSQMRRDALAKRNSQAGVASRESSNPESDVALRDDQLGSAPKPVPSAASINPKIPIISPRSASNKKIETSNDGAVPSPQAGTLSRKMQFKKLGQKHSARSKTVMDSSVEDQEISEKSERSAPAGVSSPASRDGKANNLPAPLSTVNQKRSNHNLKSQNVPVVKASPVAARKRSDVVIAAKTVASRRASPSNAPNRNMKRALLDKHRQRVNKPGLVLDTSTDETTADSESETLSQTFHDIIAEVDQNQLASAAQRHPQKTGVPVKPLLNVQTLLAFGSEEDETFDEAANPILLGTDHVGDSCSFDLTDTNSGSPTDASKRAYEIGSDAGASRSSAGANSLAARATRMMRTKHQSKTDERQEHPSGVTETTRRPLVADQATVKAGHRSPAKPTEIKPCEHESHADLQPDIERQTDVSPRSSGYETQSRFVDSLPSDSSTVTHTTGPSDAGPTDSLGGNFSFATETDESNGVSASVSEADSSPYKGERRRTTPRTRRLDMIADEFVAESNLNTDAFATAYQSLSLGQIANDFKEGVTGTLNIPGLDFSKLSRDLTESLSKFVHESHSPSKKGQLKIPTPKEHVPADERVAIEVEYVEDSDSE
jgi:hypothetical protein